MTHPGTGRQSADKQVYIRDTWVNEGGTPTGLADCCLIIPTYRRPQETAELLELIAERGSTAPEDSPAEVIVVDGTPDDSVRLRVEELRFRELPYRLRYIASAKGLTLQRNIGISWTARDFIFFLDDDSRPEPGYFQVIRDVLLRNPEAGAVGGYTLEPGGAPPRPTLRWRTRLALGLAPRTEPMRYSHCGCAMPRSFMAPFGGVREVDVLHGCAFSFRRAVFSEEVFSTYFVGYPQGEETDICLRLKNRGWKILLAGDARAVHLKSSPGRPDAFQKGYIEISHRLFIWNRHSRGRARPLDVLRLAGDMGFVVAWDLLSFLRAPGPLWGLRRAAGSLAALADALRGLPRFEDGPGAGPFGHPPLGQHP